MHIYRGPLTQELDFGQLHHELVAVEDLSSDKTPWSGSRIIRANITKDGNDRHAVVHIVLAESDVLALCSSLVEGLRNERETAKKMARELQSTRDELVQTLLRIDRDGRAESRTSTERLEMVLAHVDGFVKG